MMDQKLELSDKITQFLIEKNKQMLFDELTPEYLQAANLYDVLRGVPVPITGDATANLNNLTIAMGMARVIGAEENFRYADAYQACLQRLYGSNCGKVLLSEGAKAGESGSFEIACMYFRTALKLNPMNRDALYLYGRACLDAYGQDGKDENYVGCFKAQAIDIFEELTILHPNFDMGYYYLGYNYANLGLYTKAQITWQKFMELSRERGTNTEVERAASGMDPITEEELQEMREEIGNRLESLEGAVDIENAINRILVGDFQTGIDELASQENGPYSQWWPLWYYLGVAYAGMEQEKESVKAYRQALALSPSNIQVMTELVEVYQSLGDYANAEKYINKIHLVEKSMEEESQGAVDGGNLL